MTTQTYQQASQRFLAQAKQELAAGDLQQVSEKGWGAAAQMLKAIAEQRSWEHGKHRHLSRAASRLRAETGDRDVYRLLDDLGYLPQGAEESEVLFTLIAERYERRSLGITSNLVFSEWERIFANPMATAAAIDRVVHHSVILEFDVPSYRTNAAQQRGHAEEVNRQN